MPWCATMRHRESECRLALKSCDGNIDCRDQRMTAKRVLTREARLPAERGLLQKYSWCNVRQIGYVGFSSGEGPLGPGCFTLTVTELSALAKLSHVNRA